MADVSLFDDNGDNIERESAQPQLALGQWYWVKCVANYDDKERGLKKGDHYRWLGCVMQIGSNYLHLQAPHAASGGGGSGARVHFDDFWTDLVFEPNADEVIRRNVLKYQNESRRLLDEVKEVTARLGLKPAGALPSPVAVGEQNRALVVLNSQSSIKDYEKALILAKDTTLPELFKAIKQANNELTRWMIADTMPAKAMLGPMEDSIDEIKDRIFNVSLYAGLTEQVVQCCKGAPAASDEKLHVMQRRLYMDEECLLDYQHGGMEFKNITEFDAWIAKPENRDRIMPFPRTLVALRVRRKTKEREWDGTMLWAFIKVQLDRDDKSTYLYIRNGEQVWRLSTDMDFGELIFPDKAMYRPDEPKMVKMFCNRVETMISVAEYEDLAGRYAKLKAQSDAWVAENPDKSWIENPFRRGLDGSFSVNGRQFRPDDWKPFDQSNIYFDECMAEIENRVKEYNRIALIIQGLFDRSEVLHPHAPVQTWSPEGFAKAVQLVYDGVGVLNYGAPPDFEAYRNKCNASLNKDSVVTGQMEYWLVKEAEKENRRLDNDWRSRDTYRHKKFQPHGNPGPGRVAEMAQLKSRSKEAVFAWNRQRLTDVGSGYYAGPRRGDYIRTTVTVPVADLFNISAYKPGDFKQFFRDPRTRAQYLRWAPMLLTAEDYWAGKIKAEKPVLKDDE